MVNKCFFMYVGRGKEGATQPGDPLEWFGALVSPNLRQSQQGFIAGE